MPYIGLAMAQVHTSIPDSTTNEHGQHTNDVNNEVQGVCCAKSCKWRKCLQLRMHNVQEFCITLTLREPCGGKVCCGCFAQIWPPKSVGSRALDEERVRVERELEQLARMNEETPPRKPAQKGEVLTLARQQFLISIPATDTPRSQLSSAPTPRSAVHYSHFHVRCRTSA